MKKYLLISALAFAFVGFEYAYAANSCDRTLVLHDDEVKIASLNNKPIRLLHANPYLDKMVLTEGQLAAMNRVGLKMGLLTSTHDNFRDIINDALVTIAAKKDGSDLDRAELLAQFASKLDASVISRMKEANRKIVNYGFAMGIDRLEAFPIESYSVVPESPFKDVMTRDPQTGHYSDSETNVVSFDRYLPYTIRYIAGDTSFVKGYLLDFKTIRLMEMHNLFPAYIEHDMRHVHYGTSRPLALAAMFSSSRSQNAARSATTAAAFEAVDTVQYSQETMIAKYFRNVRHMDIEEGMTYLGRATKAELQTVMEGSGANALFQADIQKWAGFVPTTTSPDRIRDADKEIDEMITIFNTYPSNPDPQVKRALIFNKDPRIATDDGEKNFR